MDYRRNTFILPLLLCVTFFVHATYLANGFVWLDHGDIEQGAAILPPSGFWHALFERFGETGFYRPVVTCLHSLDHLAYGTWAPGFHLTNLLLHLGVVAAAFLFVRAFFHLKESEAWIAALVVGVHPLSWLPVGSISYRPDLLVSLFVLLAVTFHLRARQEGRRRDEVWAVVCAGIALLSKETSIFWLPSLLLMTEAIPLEAEAYQTRGGRASRRLLLAEGGIVLLYLALRFFAVPERWRVSMPDLPLLSAIGTRLTALGGLLGMLLSPQKPPLSDATPVVSLFHPVPLLLLAALIGIILFFLRRRVRTVEGRVLLFLLLALAPAMNLVPLPRFRSPHYGYFATVALGAAAALLIRRAASWRNPLRATVSATVGVWILAMGITTFRAGSRMKDDLTLFGPETAADPMFREGQFYVGNYHFERGEIDAASRHFEKALERPRGVLAYVDEGALFINLAGVRVAQNRLREADDLLAYAAAANPESPRRPNIAYNRALIAFREGRFEAAADILRPYQAHWKRPEPLLLLIEALKRSGKSEEAGDVARRLSELKGDTPPKP